MTTAAVTLTLPRAVDVPLGWACYIEDRGRNTATGGRNMTLNREGTTTDTFNGGATSKTMATNGILWLVKKVNTGVWSVNSMAVV